MVSPRLRTARKCPVGNAGQRNLMETGSRREAGRLGIGSTCGDSRDPSHAEGSGRNDPPLPPYFSGRIITGFATLNWHLAAF